MGKIIVVSVILILILSVVAYLFYNSSYGYCTFKIGSSELKLGDSVTSGSSACNQFMRYCKMQSSTEECKKSIEQAQLLAKLEYPPSGEFCQEQDSNEYIYHCLTSWKTDLERSFCSAKEVCFLNLAIKEKDISYCSQFREIDSCKYEFAAKTGDESVCPQLSGIQKEDCYYWIGFHYGNLKTCLNVNDSAKKEFCIWQAVKGSENQYNLNVSLYQREDILLCNEAKISENSVVPKDCYYAFTKLFGVNICEDLSGEDKINCYRIYIHYTGDKSNCGLIKELTEPPAPTDGSIPPAPPHIIECD